MKKVSMLLVFCMVLGLMFTSAFAQTPTVTVGSATGEPGDEVVVNISISETSFSGFQLKVNYDDEKLTPKSATKAAALDGFFQPNLAMGDDYIGVAFAAAEDFDVSGNLFSITFEITGELDETAVVSISADDAYNKFEAEAGELAVTYAAGVVNIQEPEPVVPDPEPIVDDEDADDDADEDAKLTPTGSQALPFILIGALLAIIAVVMIVPARRIRKQQ